MNTIEKKLISFICSSGMHKFELCPKKGLDIWVCKYCKKEVNTGKNNELRGTKYKRSNE